MVDIFLDIESVPDFTAPEYFDVQAKIEHQHITRHDQKDLYWKYKRGALSPFEGKTIMIAYERPHLGMTRLLEWEHDEKTILEKFYNTLVRLQQGGADDRLRVIGHNIRGFDLPFLYTRMRIHNIADEKTLYHRILNVPGVVDLLSLHLPLNNYTIKGLKHDVLAHAYGLPEKESTGDEQIQNYFQKNYDEIIKYSDKEFIYPELFAKIESDGLVSKQRLDESIKYYEERHPPIPYT